MLNTTPNRRPIGHSERGYILVWVMFLVAAFTIWLAVAVPRTVQDIQRDREQETVERGRQYIRAVQLYYRRFHAFPPNQNALVNTNEIRFLRKKYIDPTTGKDDWKPILWGQAKTQTLGFFGQPLTGAASAGGSMVAGIGPSGNGGINGGTGTGSSGFGSSGFGSSSMGSSSFGSSIGSSSTFGSSSSGTPSSGTTPGSPTTSTGGNGTSSTGANGSSSDANSNLQTFGGAGIIGFSPASPKQSILTYRKKNHYNEWEFIYDPMLDTATRSGNTGMIGQPAAGTPTNGSPGNTSGSAPSPSQPGPSPSSPSPETPSTPQQ